MNENQWLFNCTQRQGHRSSYIVNKTTDFSQTFGTKAISIIEKYKHVIYFINNKMLFYHIKVESDHTWNSFLYDVNRLSVRTCALLSNFLLFSRYFNTLKMTFGLWSAFSATAFTIRYNQCKLFSAYDKIISWWTSLTVELLKLILHQNYYKLAIWLKVHHFKHDISLLKHYYATNRSHKTWHSSTYFITDLEIGIQQPICGWQITHPLDVFHHHRRHFWRLTNGTQCLLYYLNMRYNKVHKLAHSRCKLNFQ